MKYLGIINNFKNKAEDEVKKQAKKVVKKAVLSALLSIMNTLLPVLLIGIGGMVILGLIDWVVEIFTSENNPELIYESLEIENVADLIEIKGDEQNGYYLDFIDGIDKKLEDVIDKYNKSAEYHNLPEDVNFLKKMLKAEVFTQFPNLKGNIPSESKDGFQGAINIRRVTPNKKPRRNAKYWQRRNFYYRAS